jgi:hypothetical protein
MKIHVLSLVGLLVCPFLFSQISVNGSQIKNLQNPTDAQDAVTMSVFLESIENLQNQINELEGITDDDSNNDSQLFLDIVNQKIYEDNINGLDLIKFNSDSDNFLTKYFTTNFDQNISHCVFEIDQFSLIGTMTKINKHSYDTSNIYIQILEETENELTIEWYFVEDDDADYKHEIKFEIIGERIFIHTKLIRKINLEVVEVDTEIYVESNLEVSTEFCDHPLAGTSWSIAAEPGALAVGPSPSDLSWWSADMAYISDVWCLTDDVFTFNADGTYEVDLGSQTWLWYYQIQEQEICSSPLAPHTSKTDHSWTVNDSTITVSGVGAYIARSATHNYGEDGNPPGDTITYNYSLDGNILEITISGFQSGGDETWYFKLVRQ